MNIIQHKLIPMLFLLFTFVLLGQTKEEIELLTKSYIEQSASNFNLSSSDITEWKITSEHKSKKSDLIHVYGIQKHHDIEVYKANFYLCIIDKNKVLSYKNNFVTDINTKDLISSNTTPKLSAIDAVMSVSKQLKMNTSYKSIKIIETPSGNNLKQLLTAKEISHNTIPAKLMYYQNSANQLILAWDLSIEELDSENWWSLKVDANSGEILDKVNWVIHCPFENHNHVLNNTSFNNLSPTANLVGGYNVYPFPVESPNHGSRSFITNPSNTNASPFGWHDTNGSNGAEFTITRGNNVHAFENSDSSTPEFSPDGGNSLTFDFPLNTTYTSGNPSKEAAITNLFYWNNILHDMWYQYGFDEASGNFQENNYGNGGIGSDYVNARAQIGIRCNATFGTPPDGFNPRMNMYVCGNRDGNFDNPVIAHEYGHGISIRLVGGAANSSGLRNQEQMGEGWSDWFGLMMTINPEDQGTNLRPIGTWLFGQGADGSGIRRWPYSTDIEVSKYTYNDVRLNTFSAPHGVGSVWASMLWELTWELINEYGYDTDLYNGTGGNNIAMQLVIEGLKLTPVNPGFVDARNAILQADQAIYNGANQCHIWTAFAKRGLGFSADQGSSLSKSDGTEAFDVPSNCHQCEEYATITATSSPVTSGSYISVSNTITSFGKIESGANVTYSAGGKNILKPSFHAKSGSLFKARIEGCNNTAKSSKQKRPQYEEILISKKQTSNLIKEEVNIIKLYPNPTSDIVTISSIENISSWVLNNSFGAIYLNENSKSNNTKTVSLDLSNYSTGIYFLNIKLKNGKHIIKKIIKE